MTALAAQAMPQVLSEGFMPLADAASKMGGMNLGHLRRLCAERFEPAGLSFKRGDGWIISKKADPRLGDIETWEARDHRQADELRDKEGYKANAIRKAERLRALILVFFAFVGHSRSEGGLCREFVNKCLADGTFRARGIKAYKPDTFRKLCDAYRKGGLRALVRKPYADRGSLAFGAKALAYFMHVMQVGHGITVCDAMKDLFGFVIQNGWRCHDDWKIPAVRTAQEWWRNNIPEPAKVLIAEGPNKLRARCIPKIARNALEDFAAGDLLVLDERNFDFMCRALGERGWYTFRAKLTALRDEVSGMIVGWYVGKRANTDTILAALNQAVIAMETTPREAIFDNGAGEKVVGMPRKAKRWDGFDQGRIATATTAMRIAVHFARVRAPWAKSIESSFAALKVFDRFQVAFTGGSPAEKPWDMVKWTKENIFELPTVDQVREQFAAFLDAYHEEPRRSDFTEGLSPRQAFRQFYTTAPRRITRETLDALCRKIVGPVKVGRDGVRHDRLRYGTRDEAVFKLQGRQVWMAVDPIERDSVILCEQDGTPICTANVDRPLGYKSDEVREAIAFQRRCEKSVKQYASSRDYLLKTTPQQIAERRKLAAKERQITDEHLSPRPEPISIELVRPDIAVAAEKVKRAAGAEAMRRLSGVNAAASAVNASRRRRVDFTELASRSEPSPDELENAAPRRVVDWSKVAEANDEPPE